MLNLPCEKVLQDAFLTGVLNLHQRQLKEFPSDVARNVDLTDLVTAGKSILYSSTAIFSFLSKMRNNLDVSYFTFEKNIVEVL